MLTKLRLVFVDRKEVEKGESEETTEHHFDKETAHKVAMDHIEKHPKYYTDLAAVGLDETYKIDKKAPYGPKGAFGHGRTGRKVKHPSTTVGSSNVGPA